MLDKFKQHLRSAGWSVTSPRINTFLYLQQHEPTTVAEVIKAQTSRTDRASVYRTLSLFRELGIIHDIVAGGQRMIELTDTFDNHHHHLTCLHCGRMQTIEDSSIEQRLNELAGLASFTPVSHQIEINGLCSTCQATNSKPD